MKYMNITEEDLEWFLDNSDLIIEYFQNQFDEMVGEKRKFTIEYQNQFNNKRNESKTKNRTEF